MQPTDRLAAYLADELDAHERVQLEALLARDPQLRRTLEAMRRADEALAQLDPVQPPEGFAARLDAALDDTLAEMLASAKTEPTAFEDAGVRSAPVDELAARRRWRAPRTLGAAAAGLVLVVGGIVAVQQSASDDHPTMEAADTESDAHIMMDDTDRPPMADSPDEAASEDTPQQAEEPTELAERPTDEAFSDQAPAQPDAGDASANDAESDGSTAIGDQAEQLADSLWIEDRGRELAFEDLQALLDHDALTRLAAERLDEAGAVALRDRESDPPMDADEPADAPSDRDAAGPQDTQADDSVSRGAPQTPSRTAIGDLTRCLQHLPRTSASLLPAYAEFATMDGQPVVVLGALTADPASGIFDRPGVWVFDRDSCALVEMVQQFR